jgi:hypothetical protein
MYGGTRMCFLRANTGSFVAKNLMPLLPRLASKHDIVLLNFGLHSNDNGSLWGYIQELEAFGEQYEQHKQQMPQFLWRQTSVQHFDTPIGDHRYSPIFRFFPGAQPDAGKYTYIKVLPCSGTGFCLLLSIVDLSEHRPAVWHLMCRPE